MSRTHKDRPLWVRENDKGNPTYHDHLKFGKVVYQREYVLDDDGDYIYEEQIITRLQFRVERAEKEGIDFWDARSAYVSPNNVNRRWRQGFSDTMSMRELEIGNPQYSHLWEEQEVSLGWFTKTVMVEKFTYKDECTAGEKVKGGYHQNHTPELPCTPMLPRGYNIYRERCTKDDRNDYYSGQRMTIRDTLREYRKLWNSGNEIDEEVDLGKQHRHEGSWWR